MKYLLVNKKTKEEHLCSKVTLNRFDYYLDDTDIQRPCSPINVCMAHVSKICDKCGKYKGLKVIATDDSNIELPQIINEDLSISDLALKSIGIIQDKVPLREDFITDVQWGFMNGFINGYEQSQESHPYTLQDMVDFAKWIADFKKHGYVKQLYEACIINKATLVEDLVGIWEKQKIKTIYYE